MADLKDNTPPLTTPKHDTHFNKNRAYANIALLRQFKYHTSLPPDTLKQYSGFGGLRRAFKDPTIQATLAEFLPCEAIDALRKSASTGYFTPPFLIDCIYQLVQKLGFKHGKLLEPACGHGAFFEHLPPTLRQNSPITGIELEPLSANIAKTLYPNIRMLNQRFQSFHEKDFDLIIGNPPYASFSVFDHAHPDLKNAMIHHYFVAKSVRLLKETGLLAMVVPCYILDNPKHHLRDAIADVADLIVAYRMPDHLFEDAKMTVDIVVFQRQAKPSKNWQKTHLVTLANHQTVYLADYFVQHPEHVLGQLDTYEAYSHFENRPRRGLCCHGSIDHVQHQFAQRIKAVQPII